MAMGKEGTSFDDIIQASRQRKKNETLAAEIFGRGRKTEVASHKNRNAGVGGSLASRVGIAKASQRSSTPKIKGDVDATWGHDLHDADEAKSKGNRQAKENPLARTFKKDLLFEAATGRKSQDGTTSEISIRGKAGPYVVIGSNFAPGTTAADIESVMLPVGGEMQSCRIITATPTVMAEMVFLDTRNAEAVIGMFNNQKADGRILHVYLKKGPPSTPSAPIASPKPLESKAAPIDLTRDEPVTSPFDSRREQADRDRRRAVPEYQDASFGFDTKEPQTDVDMDAPQPTGAVAHPPPRRDDRVYDRRNNQYEPPRSYRGGRYDDRDRGYGRPRDDRRLYSDNIYPSRGGGYR